MTGDSGKTWVPTSAIVYIIYADNSDNDPREKTAKTAYDVEILRLGKHLVKQREKDSLEVGTEPQHQRQQLVEMYYLEMVDSGLKAAERWSRKCKMQWQFTSVDAHSDGTWSAQNLRPGYYKVVARGKLGDNIDSEWETTVDVASDQTTIVDLSEISIGHQATSN